MTYTKHIRRLEVCACDGCESNLWTHGCEYEGDIYNAHNTSITAKAAALRPESSIVPTARTECCDISPYPWGPDRS